MPDHDPSYEYSEPYTVGGPSAIYQLSTPFPDRSEVAVLSVVFTDTGYVVVSPDPNPPTIGNTFTLGTNGVLRGAFYNGTANFNVAPDAIFWTVGPDRQVFVNVSITASHSAFVTFVFRRFKATRKWIQPYEVNPEQDDTYHVLREQAILALESGTERRGNVEK